MYSSTVIEIKPDFDEAYYSMGLAYTILNEFDKALEAYEKVIEIKPDDGEAYYSMGLAYAKSGKLEKAIGA
jgi:tetratricopeptide (TPR) repeat protein